MRFLTGITLVTKARAATNEHYLTQLAPLLSMGIAAVQLRDKSASYSQLLAFGQRLQQLLTPYKIPLIINDNIDLAIALNADGVHIGQADGCPINARAKLGQHKILGISIDSLDDLEKANTYPIDYVGIGAIFQSNSKANTKHIWGLPQLQKAIKMSAFPVIAIGGIDENNVISVLNTGTMGIAAIKALHHPPSATHLIQRFNQYSCQRINNAK